MLVLLQYLLIALGVIGLAVIAFGRSVTEMTFGPVAIGVACFLAILARIAQAGHHQGEVLATLATLQPRQADGQSPATAAPEPLPPVATDATGYEEKRVLTTDVPTYIGQGWRLVNSAGAMSLVARGEK